MPSPIRRRHHKQKTMESSTSTSSAAAAAENALNNSMTSLSTATMLAAGFYIASGVCQPLLMTLANNVGIADPKCQLYMVFYYVGPASVGLTLRRRKAGTIPSSSSAITEESSLNGSPKKDDSERYWPSTQTTVRAALIAVMDIFAQSLNYTGNTLSGPTVFAIIYSSVTIWAALYSKVLLGRDLNCMQWIGVVSVFLGLALTALHTVNVGQSVFLGACLVIVGSSLHALTYVVSESLMTVGKEKISIRANCAVQGIVACFALTIWQIIYTLPRFQALIGAPMKQNGSTFGDAAVVLGAITLANLVHSTTFFHTLKNFPGGSVSAGVMKALQACLVFIVTSLLFCGKSGGEEMCFDYLKLLSLIVVVGGILIYGRATDAKAKGAVGEHFDFVSSIRFPRGYKGIPDVESQHELSQLKT